MVAAFPLEINDNAGYCNRFLKYIKMDQLPVGCSQRRRKGGAVKQGFKEGCFSLSITAG